MGLLRASTIIYSDLELTGHLYSLAFVGYLDFLDAAAHGTPYPHLYDSGIEYTREPPGSEVWQTPRFTYASKQGDCEDLAAGYRTPELWSLGETAARPVVIRISPRLRHIVVRRADGTIEDPSLILGMHRQRHPTTWSAEARRARAAVLPPMLTEGRPCDFSAEVPAYRDVLEAARGVS